MTAKKARPNWSVDKEDDPAVIFTVIDGQHRINGAYLAIRILREKDPNVTWEMPANIFLNLDPAGSAPTKQAAIFIDVNFYQKKVDKIACSRSFSNSERRA